MDLRECSNGRRVLWVVVLLLVGGSYLRGAHGTSPPRPNVGISLPYVCPHDVTLKKLKFKQGEFKSFSQYTRYDTDLPTLTSFTIHYWFNLATTTNSSTFFSYGENQPERRNLLTIKLDTSGRTQHFTLEINRHTQSYIPVNPPILAGQWNHALHSWDSETRIISHYLNGELLQTHRSYQEEKQIPRGRWAISGQDVEVLYFNDGVDAGEGLNGWMTLLQMSSKPLSYDQEEAHGNAQLAYQCSPNGEGNVITWLTTPRKSHGGVSEAPSFSKACGRF